MARWNATRLAAGLLMAAAPLALVAGLWHTGGLRMPGAGTVRPWRRFGDATPRRPFRPGRKPARRSIHRTGGRLRPPADGSEADPSGEALTGEIAPAEPPQGPLADRLAPLPTPPEVAILRTAIDFNRRRRVRRETRRRARCRTARRRSRAAEWSALRLAHRARPASSASAPSCATINPDFPAQAMLRRRAEEALLSERASDRSVKAFFAEQPPQTVLGRLALARIRAAEGKAREAGEMIRDSWRRDDFGADMEARVLAAFPRCSPSRPSPARRALPRTRGVGGRHPRGPARRGTTSLRITRARIAAERAQSDAEKLVDALPKALQSDPSAVLARVQVLRSQGQGRRRGEGPRRHPQGPPGPRGHRSLVEERRALTRRLLDQGDAALAYTVAAGMPPSSGVTRIDAEFHAGWIALRFLSRPEVAAGHFAAAASEATTPISISPPPIGRAAPPRASGEPSADHFARAATHRPPITDSWRAPPGLREMPVRRVGRDAAPEGGPGLAAVRLRSIRCAGPATSPCPCCWTWPSAAMTPPSSPPRSISPPPPAT